MAIYTIDDFQPRLHASAWVADSAQLIGNVELGEDVSIWFGTIIRGDNADTIRIGARSNVQEACVLHSDPGMPLTLGEGVSIGHRAMVHGCTIGEGSLIGIGAVVLNGARIGRQCLVGAGALITEGKAFPDGSLILGSPAKAVRPLSEEQIATLKSIAEHYVKNGRRFGAGLKRLD